MIFVTVGTHEQPFNRLIQKIDELKKDSTIQDDVIIQTGFSTYEPKYCQWSKLIPYQQMVKNENILYRRKTNGNDLFKFKIITVC